MAVDTDEASLANPPLTSCCVAQFLTGHRLLLVRGPGIGAPVLVDQRKVRVYKQKVSEPSVEMQSAAGGFCS